MMLELIAHKRLPRGTAETVKAIRGYERMLQFRDVVQIGHFRDPHIMTQIGSFTKLLPKSEEPDPSFLMFRDVGEHDDDWDKTPYNGKRVAPAFAHLVIHGSMVLRVDRKRMSFKKGDMLVMDMNKRHAVESHSLCITAMVTVPRQLFSGKYVA